MPKAPPVDPAGSSAAAPGKQSKLPYLLALLLAGVVTVLVFMLMGNPDPVTKLLARSQYQRAKDRLKEVIKKAGTGKTSLYLYQMGVADLYLAEVADKAGDAKQAQQLYRTAGLSFMRVTIHFPRSKVAGPALIEAALVHLKINRKDIAAKLLKKANESVDPDDELLMKRLESIQDRVDA